MSSAFFADDNYLDLLTGFLVKDRSFLRLYHGLLNVRDFEPFDGSVTGKHRWVVASKALEHYSRYLDPIGHLLQGELRHHVDLARMGERQKNDLLDYGQRLLKRKLPAMEAVAAKLKDFKSGQQKQLALQQLQDLHAAGDLTNEKWLQICREAIDTAEGSLHDIVDYKDTLEDRIARRTLQDDTRYPLLFIDELDAQVRAVARGQLGLLIAPYKRGKSRFLIWIAMAYALQGLNSIFFTLEDPKPEVEDRFDAAVSGLPIGTLNKDHQAFRDEWQRYMRLCRGGIKIVDGTGGMSLAQMENIVLRCKDDGFQADAVIIDYDEEIIPPKAHKDRRNEFGDIYRELRRMLARLDLIGWTAAQTQRDTENLKIISGSKLAEDIGKARKAFFALSLGKGDWGPDSIYLHVAAHKNDKQHVGCNIMTAPDRMLAYDREATMEQLLLDKKNGGPRKKSQDDDVDDEEFVEV